MIDTGYKKHEDQDKIESETKIDSENISNNSEKKISKEEVKENDIEIDNDINDKLLNDKASKLSRNSTLSNIPSSFQTGQSIARSMSRQSLVDQ